MIEVKQIQCRNLRGTELRVRNGGTDGAVYLLIGAPGSGKTTLVELMAGGILPDGGSVEIGGYDSARDSRAARLLVGCVPNAQNMKLPTRETVWEYLCFVARARDLRGEAVIDSVTDVCSALELTEKIDHRLGWLSVSDQRRVLLAGALIGDPEYLLLDGITEGLPIRGRADLYRLIRQAARGRTVLLTAYTEEALPYLRAGQDAPACHLLRLAEGLVREEVPSEKGASVKAKNMNPDKTAGLRLYLSIKGDPEGIKRTLQGIPGVARIEDRGSRAGLAVLTLLLDTDPHSDGEDVRDEVFFTMAEKRYTVLSMTAETSSAAEASTAAETSSAAEPNDRKEGAV